MDKTIDVLTQILDIAAEMSPYLLLGFLLAGLMHAFIPGTMYSRYLSGGSFTSVLYAAMFGVPLPLCSCGVIPTAMSLRKEGASRGATVSFLIATPQTGVDSIIATYSLMGLPFAIVRPVAALCTALLGGQLANLEARFSNPDSRQSTIDNRMSRIENRQSPLPVPSFLSRLRSALHYGFVEMMGDIGKWLVIGLIAAGLITALVPDSFFAVFRGNTLLSMLLVLAIAIPMYVCATGSIPIAVALMMKGLTPGSALVLLMAGPACNVASMLVVGKVLGRKTLAVYLASIILGSIAFGTAIDTLLPAEWFVPVMHGGEACCHSAHSQSWFSLLCSAVLLLLLLNALAQHYIHPHSHSHGEESQQQSAAAPHLDFTVQGMTCSHCAAAARRALEALPGVTGVDIDLASGRAHVVGKATLEQASAALAEVGFSVC